MSFFIQPKVETALDVVTEKLDQNPRYDSMFAGLSDLRSVDDGSLYRGSEFKRVAHLQGPLLDLAMVLDPDFLQDKKKFYAFLDAHPEHCTYDRRKTKPVGDGLFHGFNEVINGTT